MAKSDRPATGEQIRAILGPVDDEIVMEVLRTGASLREVREACEWRDEDDYIGARLHKKMSPQCRQVYDLLSEREEPDEERTIH